MKRISLPMARIAELYAIGVSVRRIAEDVSTTQIRVKGLVRRQNMKRQPQRYAEGVAYLAEPDETFRPTNTPGYWVSDRGQVLSMRDKPGTAMKPEVDKDGYLRLSLWRGGVPQHWNVHRLVALAFIGEPAEGQLIAHNNGQRDDNRAENLRWATQAENVADKIAHGTAQIGSKHGAAITDEVAVARVKAAFRIGKTIQQAADAGGVTFYIAADVKRGRTWRHVA